MGKRWFRTSLVLGRFRRLTRNDQVVLSVLACLVGAAVGGAVILFRLGIAQVQSLAFGFGGERLHAHAQGLAWWHILLVPAAGGLAVGLLVHFSMAGRRNHGVADVIEANALGGGRMSLTQGLRQAVIDAISIGAGASVGREGPAVHLGASLGGWLAKRLHLTRSLSRTLLGCGVAAAVAASFNAPIAGALFASEVVIGHYALSALAPVVIASVAGTAVSRAFFGDFPAFAIPHHDLVSYWEFPAFAGLGVVAGIMAVVFLRAIIAARAAADGSPLPPWSKPAFGGLAVGAIAVFLPQVLGVGYGATESALNVAYPLYLLALAKTAAVALSLGFGFGGGVFSPSLVIGAMVGGAYGIVATQLFPEFSSGAGAYALIGMGAMAAPVLGAPISTTLIIFEMTGNLSFTVAVMVAVVIATVITRQVHGHTFFSWQLECRGLDLGREMESALLRSIRVADLMVSDSRPVTRGVGLRELREMLQASPEGEIFVVDDEGRLVGTITLAGLSEAAFEPALDGLVNAGDVARLHPPMLSAGDNLETALQLFRDTGEHDIAVVETAQRPIFVGHLGEREAITAYNRALIESRRQERGE